MRKHAGVSTRRLSTTNYSEAARKRLGEAVAQARDAAGFHFRTDFGRTHHINPKSLELLELGKPGVGQSILFAVGRALPGWTEETPRVVLEGGSAPAAPVQAHRGSGSEEDSIVSARRALAVFDLAQLLAGGADAKTYQVALGRHYSRLGEQTNMVEIATEAQQLADDPDRLRRVQEDVRRALGGERGTDSSRTEGAS